MGRSAGPFLCNGRKCGLSKTETKERELMAMDNSVVIGGQRVEVEEGIEGLSGDGKNKINNGIFYKGSEKM